VDDATARELGALKAAIVEGHRTRNRAALDTLYAEDYLATDPRGGARTKADLLDGLAAGPAMLEGAYTLTAARRWGDVAVAAGHGRMVFRDGDSTRVVEYDSVNVFEWRGGRWWYAAAYLP
jgi:ketosteroid isomerase-like protein